MIITGYPTVLKPFIAAMEEQFRYSSRERAEHLSGSRGQTYNSFVTPGYGYAFYGPVDEDCKFSQALVTAFTPEVELWCMLNVPAEASVQGAVTPEDRTVALSVRQFAYFADLLSNP